MGAGGAFCPVGEILVLLGIENEYRDGSRLSVVAQEFVHDVEVLVAQEDAQLHSRSLGDARGCRQLTVDIATPGLSQSKNFCRTTRMRCRLAEERNVLVGEWDVRRVGNKFVLIDRGLRHKIGVGEALCKAGWSDYRGD